MSSGMNWRKASLSNLMRQRGSECAREEMPPLMRPLPRRQGNRWRRPMSKAELRLQSEAAVAAWHAKHPKHP